MKDVKRGKEEGRRQGVWISTITPYLDSVYDVAHIHQGGRNRNFRNMLARLGSRAGTPDLIFHYKNEDGLSRFGFIEVKLEDNKTLVKNQLIFQEWCKKNEIPHYVVGYIDTFIDVLDKHKVINKDSIYSTQAGAIRIELIKEKMF